MKTSFLVAMIMMLLSDISVKGQTCDIHSGPVGNSECVKLAEYDDYQWAICLSNAYIKLKSSNKHFCKTTTATYCWYQCQVERFDLDEGTVYDECRCNDGDQAEGDDTSLPEWCFSPSGTECNWYRDCLEKRHPCEASGNGYALSYAEKFCNLYTERSRFFTAEGLQWVNAVRKCLQVALVPLIRPWSNPTCEELKKFAFDSHTPCYLAPFGAPSICDLGCWDWAQVFWTIKSGFTQAFVESMKGVVDVTVGCGKKFTLLDVLDDSCPSVMVRLTLTVALRTLIGKRSTDQELVLNNLAGSVADELAMKLKWDKRVMDWYAYAPNNTNNRDVESDKVEVEVLFGDKSALDLTDEKISNAQPDFSLKNTVQNLATAVEKGVLHNMVIDNMKVSVTSMTACQDVECEESFIAVTAGPPSNLASFSYGDIYITPIITMITVYLHKN